MEENYPVEILDQDLNKENLIGEESLIEEEEQATIEDFLSVYISPNKMEAYINIIPIDNSVEISVEIIKEQLFKNNVTFGIDDLSIKEVLDNKHSTASIKVASGEISVNGEDGYLTYHFNTQPSTKPKLLEDGSVDFHNLDIIQNVVEDQLLVTYTPPTEGKDGCLVNGNIIPSKKGKGVLLPKGKKVKISEDGLQLLAERDGNVEIIDGKVCVSNIMIINKNVDVSTGDIYFNGDIVIMGNIVTGSSVTATGSISVEGSVEAATLKADGDIVLKNGIQGSGRGKITAGGNIATKFIEMSDIYAKGTITTNAIMNSTIESEEDIIVSGKRGFIIGGISKALNKIQATGLGNISEIITTLEVGFTEDNVKEMVNLERTVEIVSEELRDIEANMNSFSANINRIELIRAKIEKSAKYTSSLREYERLVELKNKMGMPRVDIERTINVGCTIFMRTDVYKVKKTMKSSSFRFSQSNKIVIISYNKN